MADAQVLAAIRQEFKHVAELTYKAQLPKSNRRTFKAEVPKDDGKERDEALQKAFDDCKAWVLLACKVMAPSNVRDDGTLYVRIEVIPPLAKETSYVAQLGYAFA